MSLFNKDFYPTPEYIINQMLFGIDLEGETVLEPSAGKGDIIDVLKKQSSDITILACEKNKELAGIVMNKADEFLKEDFLEVTSQDISHIDYIIMNPPFSADEKHILHAWEICPEGCQIISLCNYETLDNRFSYSRKQLKFIVNENGYSENIGQVFQDSERKTDIEVGLIKLWKEKTGEDEFAGYFDSEGIEELDGGGEQDGLMSYNSIREMVNRYVGAVRQFESIQKVNEDMNQLIEPIGGNHTFEFGCFQKSNRLMMEVSKEKFKKDLQKAAWEQVFTKMNMQKYVTLSVLEDVNRFVEKNKNTPFTMKNVYKMIEIIIGTHGERMQKVIVQAFDEITSHHHENRYQLEGWKTNDQYRVGKKFILPSQISVSYGGRMEANWRMSKHGTDMDDIHKALCYVTATKFDDDNSFRKFINDIQPDFGEKYKWGFFEIKGYKKGTLHCRFLDDKVWDEFNKVACKAKGFHLAEKFTSDFRRKTGEPESYKS